MILRNAKKKKCPLPRVFGDILRLIAVHGRSVLSKHRHHSYGLTKISLDKKQ